MNFDSIIDNWVNGNKKDSFNQLQELTKNEIFNFCYHCQITDNSDLIYEIMRYLNDSHKTL